MYTNFPHLLYRRFRKWEITNNREWVKVEYISNYFNLHVYKNFVISGKWKDKLNMNKIAMCVM